MRSVATVLIGCLMAIPAALARPAIAGEAEDVLRRVEDHYRGVGSLRASFRQTEKVATLGRAKEDSGVVMFRRPSGMRWEYAPPREKLIVASGDVLWISMPDERRAYRYPLDRSQLARSPLALLFDREQRLGGFFTATGLTRTGNEVRVQLKPAQTQETTVSVTLIVNDRDARVTGTIIRDVFGNVTSVWLDEVVEGAALDPSLFAFRPPTGYVVSNGQEGGTR